jgi:nicotinamide mononucleotide transporter
LAAQWLLNFKKIENWFFWIAADVIYVPLYFAKHLDLTGIVYVLFLTMCFAGLVTWQHLYRADRTLPADLQAGPDPHALPPELTQAPVLP